MASPNTTFTSGQILTAAQVNNLPFGLCGLQTITSQFATSATHTTFQDTGATLTITEVSGRRYKICSKMNVYPPGGLQGVNVQILRGASAINRGDFPPAAMDTGVSFPTIIEYDYTSVASGSATFKVQIAAASANTQVADFGSSTYPRQFWIEDLGPA
jgi:hypothetical protein